MLDSLRHPVSALLEVARPLTDLLSARRSDAASWLATGMGLGVLDGDQLPGIWEWLRRSGLAHRVVWAIPEDALSEGWSTDTDTAQDVTADLDRRLELLEAAVDAMGTARIYGGCWIWPVTLGDNWAEPISDGPHQVEAVQVICGLAEGVPVAWHNDPARPDFGRPSLLQVTIARGGQSWAGYVHTSRLAYVPGSRAAPNQRTDADTYDVSTLQLYLAAIADMERAWSSSASLVSRLSVWWWRMKGAVGALTGAQASEVEYRLQLFQSNVSSRSLVPILNDDEMGWAGPSVGGVRDLVNALAERMSAVEGVPLSRFFGTPPGGLSTDDAAGRRAYNALLTRERAKLAVALLRVYDIVLGPNDARRVVWPELDQPTALEAAQVSLTNAQRDAILVQQVGSLLAEESRARFADGEESPLPVLDDAAWNVQLAEPEAPVMPGEQAPAEPLVAEGAPTLEEADELADPEGA